MPVNNRHIILATGVALPASLPKWGLWDADEPELAALKNIYLEVESWMEDLAGEGDYQGGNVDIITKDDMASWGDSMDGILAKVHAKHPRGP
jgi:cobaltochelatase CobN